MAESKNGDRGHRGPEVGVDANWRERALQELTADRLEYATRIARIDVALDALRNLAGEHPAAAPREAPSAPPREVPPAPIAATPKAKTRKSSTVGREILTALRQGPLTPADLGLAVHMETGAVMYHAKKLVASGDVVVTGSANFNRRVALASASAAKEAP